MHYVVNLKTAEKKKDSNTAGVQTYPSLVILHKQLGPVSAEAARTRF